MTRFIVLIFKLKLIENSNSFCPKPNMCPIAATTGSNNINKAVKCVECVKRIVYFEANQPALDEIFGQTQQFRCLNTDDSQRLCTEDKTILSVNNSVSLTNKTIVGYSITLNATYRLKSIRFPHHFMTCKHVSIFLFVSIFLLVNLILLSVISVFLYNYWRIHSHICKFVHDFFFEIKLDPEDQNSLNLKLKQPHINLN